MGSAQQVLPEIELPEGMSFPSTAPHPALKATAHVGEEPLTSVGPALWQHGMEEAMGPAAGVRGHRLQVRKTWMAS